MVFADGGDDSGDHLYAVTFYFTFCNFPSPSPSYGKIKELKTLERMTTEEYNDCVDQHADGLYRFALRLMDNRVLAEDLVQEAFTRLWEKREGVKANSARSYLFTTLYNASVDLLRSTRPQVDVEEVKTPVYQQPTFDIQERLNRGLALLPEVQRTVILLRDYEGYNYAEIGEIAHLSEAQVKVYIHRARQFLRNYLGDLEELIG